jgi:hypothetical protein
MARAASTSTRRLPARLGSARVIQRQWPRRGSDRLCGVRQFVELAQGSREHLAAIRIARRPAARSGPEGPDPGSIFDCIQPEITAHGGMLALGAVAIILGLRFRGKLYAERPKVMRATSAHAQPFKYHHAPAHRLLSPRPQRIQRRNVLSAQQREARRICA